MSLKKVIKKHTHSQKHKNKTEIQRIFSFFFTKIDYKKEEDKGNWKKKGKQFFFFLKVKTVW